MNFQDWFELYLSTYKRDIKPRTREEYVRQNRVYIAPIIGAHPSEIEGFKIHLNDLLRLDTGIFQMLNHQL